MSEDMTHSSFLKDSRISPIVEDNKPHSVLHLILWLQTLCSDMLALHLCERMLPTA